MLHIIHSISTTVFRAGIIAMGLLGSGELLESTIDISLWHVLRVDRYNVEITKTHRP